MFTSKNPSTTDFGGKEMSQGDVRKLRAAYGCGQLCGGWQRNNVGGDTLVILLRTLILTTGTLTGSPEDAMTTPCEWILEAAPGQGITISITKLTNVAGAEGAACSTDYLEVHHGDSEEGALVKKICSGSLEVKNYQVWVRWVRSGAGSAGLGAQWTTFKCEIEHWL